MQLSLDTQWWVTCVIDDHDAITLRGKTHDAVSEKFLSVMRRYSRDAWNRCHS